VNLQSGKRDHFPICGFAFRLLVYRFYVKKARKNRKIVGKITGKRGLFDAFQITQKDKLQKKKSLPLMRKVAKISDF